MNTSFYNGISGIKTHQFGLDVWADNISNVDTTGFRSNTPEFATQFSTVLTDAYFDSTMSSMGLGSTAQRTALNLEEGVLQPTDSVFDLALGGEGWFGIKSLDNQVYYTRTGEFSVDAEGNLVDGAGNYLVGTSAGNISPVTLSDEKMENFGQYYRSNDIKELGTPYSVTALEDVQLGAINTQNSINLPDFLYFPPEATTYVNYQANLNPQMQTKTSYVSSALNVSEFDVDMSTNTASLSGSLSAETSVDGLKAGDTISITLFDQSDGIKTLTTTLDENLEWSIADISISDLDTTDTISLADEIQVDQEIANVEHFTTEVIAPNGDKNFIDMTFTKQVPQESLQTTWDADIMLLSYFEPYVIETYDPSKTYDENLYEIDTQTNQVKKIYDPEIYYVDEGQDKVYEIIDSQQGSATFGGGGELLQSDIPELSNSGVPLQISIGDPYEVQAVQADSLVVNGSNITITGTTQDVEAGKSIQVDVSNEDGNTIKAFAVVQEDGTWSAFYEDSPFDENDTLTSDAYAVLSSGFDGMISHVDLDKARRSDRDGFIEGYLSDYGMDANGNIVAQFDNGRSTPIAKVAVYHFQNDQGLEKITASVFAASANSGEPLFYTDEEGNAILGSRVYSNRLESSNVQITTALTELIVMQKAFDASARSITTSDELIQNAINMKR